MKCDELKLAENNTYFGNYYYKAEEVDEAIEELKDELNRFKAREDVLCTDNRDLLEKTKTLEDRLRENAEHFKRNEAQILEASNNEIKVTKRALWMARAEMALTEAERNRTIENGWKMFRGNYEIAKEYSNSATKWDKVEQLCRKKAEEYK